MTSCQVTIHHKFLVILQFITQTGPYKPLCICVVYEIVDSKFMYNLSLTNWNWDLIQIGIGIVYRLELGFYTDWNWDFKQIGTGILYRLEVGFYTDWNWDFILVFFTTQINY